MKYQDVSCDEKLYPVKIQFLSFTCEVIEVFNLATSISVNRKQYYYHHSIAFFFLKNYLDILKDSYIITFFVKMNCYCYNIQNVDTYFSILDCV